MKAKRGAIKPPPSLRLPQRDDLSFDEHFQMIQDYQQRFKEWSDKCKEEYGNMDDETFEQLGSTSIMNLLKAFHIRSSRSTVLNKWRWRQFCMKQPVLKPKDKAEFLPVPQDYLLLPHSTRYDEMEGLQRIPINVIFTHILPFFDDPRDIASLMLTCRQFQKVCHCKLLLLAQQRYGQEGATPKALLLECALCTTTKPTRKMLRLTPKGYNLANGQPRKLVQQVILEHGCVEYLDVAKQVMQEQQDAMIREHAFVLEQSVLRTRIVNDGLASAGLSYINAQYSFQDRKIFIEDKRIEDILKFLWHGWLTELNKDVKEFVTLKKDTFHVRTMKDQLMFQIAVESDLSPKFFRNDWCDSWVLKRIGLRLMFDRLVPEGREHESLWRYVCSRRFFDTANISQGTTRMVWFLHEPENSNKLRFYMERDVEFQKLSKSSLYQWNLHYLTDYVANPLALPEDCTPSKRQKMAE